jgi:hypothetical protein
MTEYAGRARTGVAIILFMSALAVWTLAGYCAVTARDTAAPHEIVMDEGRFAGIRALLPLRGTVGYLSDTGGRRENPKAYFLTQYFLAPVVVAPDTAHELVVANFAASSAISAVAASHGLGIEKDFSNGVALLRRTSR